MDLCDINQIRALLEIHGFHFSKAKGQNFLTRAWVPARIAEEAGVDETCGVLEVGPGIGCLTEQLCLRAGKVCAVEVDTSLAPILEKTVGDFENLTVKYADVRRLDLQALVAEEFAGLRPMACANLPYYITSPILTALLESRAFSAVTVMVQREAADRICAPLGSRESGALTVAVNYYARPEILFKVSRGSFMPPPNVDSAVIRMVIRERPEYDVGDESVFFRAVKAGFSQRRKTLSNSLTSGGFLSREQALAALEQADIPPNTRIEALDMAGLAALSRSIFQIKS